MNKKIYSIIVFLAFQLIIGFGMIFAQNFVLISVESAPMKEKPKNFSKTIKVLSLNDKIEVIEDMDNWLFAAADDGSEGYVQSSLIDNSGISLGTGDDIAQGDASTAGARGFNEDVENEYKKNNTTFNYDAVDDAEKLTDKYAKEHETLFEEFRKNGELGEYSQNN